MKKKLYIILLFQMLIISAFGITVTTTAPNTGVSKVMTVDNGKVYELNFNTDVLSSSVVEVNIKELGLTIASQQISTNGNHALTFTPTSNTITIEFNRMDMGTASLQFEVDNIQLKEVVSSELTHEVGIKNYELSDHLGNLRTTVSDKKVSGSSKVISANDYYPYGMVSRKSKDGARHGFNGKEVDDENIVGGGVSLNYGMRIYNSSIAKFFNVDPLVKDYPWYTPYQFAGNKPIIAIDMDGLEEYIVIRVYDNEKFQQTTLMFVPEAARIKPNGVLYFDFDVSESDKMTKYFGTDGIIHKNTNYEEFMDRDQETFTDGIWENKFRDLEKNLNSSFEKEVKRKISTQFSYTYDALKPQSVYFEENKSDESELSDDESKKLRVARNKIRRAGIKADIVGHTNNNGSVSANKKLAKKRISTVLNFITGGANPILGIHAKKEQATAKPIGEAGKSIENKEDKIKNRRVDIIPHYPSKPKK